MSPVAKKTKALLYSSDALSNEVDIYAANGKSNTLLGQLTGFDEPYGECTDASGNVYITDLQAKEILEYAHAGTTPVKTLTDSYGNPNGCAVNPKTGDLAVTNFEGGASGYGSLVVYASASGSGTFYSIGAYTLAWPPVYDHTNANLFFETENDSTHKASLLELGHKSSKLITVALPSSVTINSPSGATWDGKYVDATDEQYEGSLDEGLYRLAVSGSKAALKGQAEYTDTCYYSYSTVVQPIIYNGKFLGGNFYCYYASVYHIDYWDYATGGNPIRYIDAAGQQDTSYGQAISK